MTELGHHQFSTLPLLYQTTKNCLVSTLGFLSWTTITVSPAYTRVSLGPISITPWILAYFCPRDYNRIAEYPTSHNCLVKVGSTETLSIATLDCYGHCNSASLQLCITAPGLEPFFYSHFYWVTASHDVLSHIAENPPGTIVLGLPSAIEPALSHCTLPRPRVTLKYPGKDKHTIILVWPLFFFFLISSVLSFLFSFCPSPRSANPRVRRLRGLLRCRLLRLALIFRRSSFLVAHQLRRGGFSRPAQAYSLLHHSAHSTQQPRPLRHDQC